VWPEPVERIAAFLRASGAQAQLEELPAGVDTPPGPTLRAAGFECDGHSLVALVPADRAIDRDKLAAVAGCAAMHPAPLPDFPFQPARVFLDHSALSTSTVWLEAGSPRHVLGLPPSQLARLTRAETGDLLLEANLGEVHGESPG
jgi:prolyl-tRNA editing enzyme YbaK/EbsC (Cys-tRNA(Pro) deacylase)